MLYTNCVCAQQLTTMMVILANDEAVFKGTDCKIRCVFVEPPTHSSAQGDFNVHRRKDEIKLKVVYNMSRKRKTRLERHI